MNIWQKLQRLQVELKAPKTQFNKFGGYKYRSCEDIQESVKPLLDKYGVVLMLSDEVQGTEENSRVYIKAIATLIDVETGESIKAAAYAREPVSKKGMDESQITGAASSYARKYALNGLLLIDDTKDADATNCGEEVKRSSDAQKWLETDHTNGFESVESGEDIPFNPTPVKRERKKRA